MDNYDLEEDNSNNGLMTKVWGPGAWTMLESCAFGYPKKPTELDKDRFFAFYQSIQHVLPCKYCKDSFTIFLEEEDTKLTRDVLKNRDTLTKWIYDIHNKVNKKLNVDYGITYDNFVTKYESFRAKCVKDTRVAGCNMPLKDKNKAFKMAYNKDFPLLNCDIVCKFMNYAKQRGISSKEFYFYDFFGTICNSNTNYHEDSNCDTWFKRNNECNDIMRRIRTGEALAIETDGLWKGLPTKDELSLIIRFTTSLETDKLYEVANLVANKFNKKRYYLINAS